MSTLPPRARSAREPSPRRAARARPSAALRRPRPRRRRSGARRSTAASATLRPAGSSPGGASTRSARPGTSRTPRSRSRCASTIPRSCTTGRAPSTSRGPSRPGVDGVRTSCSAWPPPRRADRGRAAQGLRPPDLAVLPQTSTIASHLPRAVGDGLAIDRAARLGLRAAWPEDAMVVCSFGDASLNHATAQAALNTAAQIAHQGAARCRSSSCARTTASASASARPRGWVESALRARPALRVRVRRRARPAEVLGVARRARRVGARAAPPAVLHLRTVRYLSHAGADVETAYRTPQEIRADYARDPILGNRALARRRRARRRAPSSRRLPGRARARCVELALEVGRAAAADHGGGGHARRSRRARPASSPSRRAACASHDEPLTLAQAINAALADVLERHPKRSSSARTSP